MKNFIKIFLITVFVFIISWQVLSIASYTPFNYDQELKCVEQTELYLADAARTGLMVSLRANEGKLKEEDSALIDQLIDEYNELKNNDEYKQKVMEEIAALHYWAKDYEAAFEQAQNVLKEYPKSLTASEVLAVCYHKKAAECASKESYDEAIVEYENLFNSQVPDGIKAFAKFYMAKMYEKKQDKRMALTCYQEIVDEYPNAGWKKRALKKLEDEKAGIKDEAK